MEMKPKPVPSSFEMRLAKWVLPMPGSPKSRIGASSRLSLLVTQSDSWRLMSSSTSEKFGKSSYNSSITGKAEGLTEKRLPPALSILW